MQIYTIKQGSCILENKTGKKLNNKYFLSIVLFTFFIFGIQQLSNAQLAVWPNSWSGVAASPLDAPTKGTNVGTAQLARVGLTGVSSSARYNSSAWSASAYVTITLTASTGFVLNLNSQTIAMAMGSSNTGPNSFTLRSSVDGYVASLGSLTTSCSSSAANTITLPATGFNGLATITFRIFGTLTGCNGTFSNGGTGGPASLTINGSTSVSSTVPTVITAATPSVLTSTAATLGGNVTATGGASISANGIVYSLTAINATPAISGSGVTQLATVSPGAGTGIFSDATGSVLSVNAQYSYRAYAANVSGTSYGGAGGTTFYTLANVPAAPTVNAATVNSLAVALNTSGNPAATQFAIQESNSGNYVQANGSLGATAVWQTAAAWGTKTVTGLTVSTNYSFRSKARNNAATQVETAFGTATTKSTLVNTIPAPTVNTATTTSLNVTINANANPASTQYSIKESSGNYLQANGTLSATIIWQTALTWGTKTVTGLIPSTAYSFQVNARNADNVETGPGTAANKATLANTPGAPIVDAATSSTLNVTINQNANSAFAEYAIYESTTGNFVQADGSFSGTPVWQIADLWGTKTVVDLASLTQYTFQVIARNPDLVETVLSNGTDGFTLDAGSPFLSATMLTGFGSACLNTSTAALSFTLTGQNLTAEDVVIAELDGYNYSINESGPYTSTLTISQPGGDFTQLIYVQFTATAVQSYNGNIIAGGAGAGNINIPTTGDGINTVPTIVTGMVSGIGINAATVNANITLTGCTAVSGYGAEYSTVPGFINGTGITIPGNNLSAGVFSVDLSGLNTGTIYYYHAYATNAGGTAYSSEGSFTTLTPMLGVDALPGFGNVCTNNTAGPNTFTITGSNLSSADVTVASLNGFIYSTDDNQYFSSLSMSQPGGSFSQLIYVKFTPVTVQSYNGNIIIAGAGSVNVNRSVTGSGINISPTVVTGTSPVVTQITATVPGTITATGCTAISNYGIEYSTINGFANGTGINMPGTNLAANAFSVSLNNLAANTTYYYKAFATNSGGTSYGIQQSFTTSSLVAPLATDATNILGNSFVANWNTVTGATSYRLDVSTSSTFSGNTNATDLFFSEYIEGSGNNKYLEIYNGTGSTVDLSNYRPRLYSNGVTAPTFNVQLSGNLATGNTVVLKNGSAAIYSGTATVNAAVNWNGDDAFDLLKISTNAVVDIFGRIGEDPGTAWTSGALSTLDKTLVRKSGVTGGVIVNPASGFPTLATEWDVFLIDDVSHLDAHTHNGNGPSFVNGYDNLTVNGTSQLVNGLALNTTYYYRVRAFSTNSTSSNSNTISVQTCFILPTITGNTSFCQGASTVLTSSAASSYQWNLNGSPINGQTNQSITITSAGDYTVTVTNATGCTGISAITTVTVNPTPAAPTISAGGTTTFCDGSSVLLTSSAATGNQWNLNGSPISGQTNQTLNVTASGDYTVSVTNGFGCSATSTITTVTVIPTPVIPTMSGEGPTTFCSGGSVLLTSSSATNNQWNLNGSQIGGATNQSLVVTASGDYTVTVTNGFSCSATSAITTVTANPSAATPTASVVQPTCAVATGTINVTSPLGAGNTYSLDGVNFQSGTSFPGKAPGTYTLYVNNSFGCFAPTTVNVTVDPQPFIPAAPTVTGIVNVCPYIAPTGGAPITFHASSPGATSYSWTIPAARVIVVSGQGTADLTVRFDTGYINVPNKQFRVKATSVCGTSALTVFYTLAQYPATPNPITGPSDACPYIGTATTVTYTTNKALSATGYIWTLPAGVTATHPNPAGENDTTIVVTFTSGFTVAGNITVNATNDCGTSGARNIFVSRNPPPQPGLITGPVNACEFSAPNGTPATYSVVGTPGVIYTWTPPAGYTNLTGQGTNSISFIYPNGFTTGTLSVIATSGCGTSVPRNLSIYRYNPAVPGVIDVIQTHFCGEGVNSREFTYQVSSMPAQAVSVQWTVPASATLVSGQGTTMITVSYPDAAVSGYVTAQGVSNCASGTVRSTTVHLPACPPPGFAGTGNKDNPQLKGITSVVTPAAAETMEVKIFPNPTVSDFKIQVLTFLKEDINVRIFDGQGRLVKVFKLEPNQPITLGSELKAGSYLIEVRQGREIKTEKLVRF